MVARGPATVDSAGQTGSFALGTFSAVSAGNRCTRSQQIPAAETTGAVEVVEVVGDIEAAASDPIFDV